MMCVSYVVKIVSELFVYDTFMCFTSILWFIFFLFFFFFRQKTAYEMRISDLSSDVCSSDLRGDRFETAHRLDQYLELSVIGLDHVIEILHLPVGRLPVQLSFALQFGDRCTIARRFVGIERGRLFPVLQAS